MQLTVNRCMNNAILFVEYLSESFNVCISYMLSSFKTDSIVILTTF